MARPPAEVGLRQFRHSTGLQQADRSRRPEQGAALATWPARGPQCRGLGAAMWMAGWLTDTGRSLGTAHSYSRPTSSCSNHGGTQLRCCYFAAKRVTLGGSWYQVTSPAARTAMPSASSR
jgi:hypothetical protein